MNPSLASAASQARWIIRVFYGFVFLFATNDIPSLLRYRYSDAIDSLWPVSWLNWVPLECGVIFIICLFLASSLIAAIWPAARSVRVLAFVGLIEFLALKGSYGKIGHSMHLWLIVAGIFIVLPKQWIRGDQADTAIQRRLLQVFALAQAFVLLTYTMSGLGKILMGVYQMALGEYHSFHPMAFALHVADRLAQTNLEIVWWQTEWLGRWIVDHPWLSWPFFLGAIYIQFASFFVVHRPELHRLWGVLLISSHLGIAATMGIFFNESMFILFLLLILSPFDQGQFSWRQRIKALPGINWRRHREIPLLKE
jgi:hypothetical protein